MTLDQRIRHVVFKIEKQSLSVRFKHLEQKLHAGSPTLVLDLNPANRPLKLLRSHIITFNSLNTIGKSTYD